MKLLDKYLEYKEEIFNYFGYVEDWVVIPIEDRREMYWHVESDDPETSKGGGEVIFYEKPLTETVIANGDYYVDEIYTQRFLPKWIYRKEDYTMICVDTHTDGNKFLAIYDNSKETKI